MPAFECLTGVQVKEVQVSGSPAKKTVWAITYIRRKREKKKKNYYPSATGVPHIAY